MIEAVCTKSETTRRYIPEGSNLHTCHCENLKSHFMYIVKTSGLVSVKYHVPLF